MQIAEYKNREIWDKFVISQGDSQFLESWAWGELLKKESRQIFRFALTERGQNKILAAFLLIKMPLAARRSYFYTPRGPVFAKGFNNAEIWNLIAENINKISKGNNIAFWRFEPILPLPETLANKLHTALPIQPKNTSILDLNNSEEEILNKMHAKTRYNIRLAAKKGVKVKIISNSKVSSEDFEDFWRLLKETSKRNRFSIHPQKHYFNIIKSNLETKLFFAVFADKIIAANMILNFGNTSTYLHGASAGEFRNLMPTYLLQWEAIKEAKRAGYHYYDFWGINKVQSSKFKVQSSNKWDYKKKWEGITLFKKGFGGKEVNLPGAYETPINSLEYKLYKLLKN